MPDASREAAPLALDSNPYAKGCGYADGAYKPIAEMTVSVLDWGFNKSDVTYDVVHVWQGGFFRLEAHLDRFFASMAGLRMTIPQSKEEVAEILTGCVRKAGLRDAYVAMVTTRGVPAPGMPRKPSLLTNRFLAYALFDSDGLSILGFLLDAVVIVLIALFAYRMTRAHRMVSQYPWLYERAGLLGWREKAE